jgi:tRNA modification GTPase
VSRVRSRDTIVAIATAPGRAAIGIVRLSGPSLSSFSDALTGRLASPRVAQLATFRDATGQAIDTGIALYFPAPHSYTAEDVLELQCHGGPVVLRLVLQRCVELGARIAEPGEFTRRAFLNGKLDLAQAEGVADLIDAATTQAARSAVRSLQGVFSSRIRELTDSVVELRASVEATIDFPDDYVAGHTSGRLFDGLKSIRAKLDAIFTAAARGSVLRDGLRVVIAGRPNVGKSSVLNKLAGEELAIVAGTPGTTRDPIRETIDIDGIPVHLTDTAGLRETTEPVERIGVERTLKSIAQADAVLVVVDAQRGLTAKDREVLAQASSSAPHLFVMNKIDLIGRRSMIGYLEGQRAVWLSARTGEGISLLREAIAALGGGAPDRENGFLARERHLTALRKASAHLQAVESCTAVELVAEELRLAQTALSTITGEYTADDLLGEIFSRFCIGK